jgi:hypothetical protein
MLAQQLTLTKGPYAMTNSPLATIILRFRDLVTGQGQTVEHHREIIATSGHVWWGWWRKRDETIPDDAFRILATKANGDGGLEAYLMDSGQERLYRVVCTDIFWDAKKAEIASPGKTETPEYYNEQKYLAWFKLTEIADVADPVSVLHQFSYLRVDEFFEDSNSAYEPFYGKRVFSVKELRQQDRTIWFVRPFQQNDPIQEVSLLDSRKLAPLHFATEYFESRSAALLWVSDTHFSERHHAFPSKPGANDYPLADQIKTNFKDKSVAGLIMSGDITWQALPAEYDTAKEFIRSLTYWSFLKSDQIAVCPGNHDLSFSEDPADKDKPIAVVGDDFKKAYSTFYQDTFNIGPNEFLSCGKRFLMGKAVPVDIVCLNSSSLQQLKNAFQGHGFIGDRQMNDAAEQMKWEVNSEKPRAYRIVVLHHHVLPTTYSATPEPNYPYSVVLDAEALSRWITKHRVDLVLHGHMHQPFCARISRPIDVNKPQESWHEFNVIGMGSSGVKGELGEINQNTVGFLEFAHDELSVSVHSVHSVNPSKEIWTVKLKYHS